MEQAASQFKLRIIERSVGIGEACQESRQVGGKVASPDDGASGAVASADRLVVAIQHGVADQAGWSGRVWKPNSTSGIARSVVGPNHRRCGGNEFLQSCRTFTEMLVNPTKIVQCGMETRVESETGVTFSGSQGSLEVTE
eukprot:scaffold25059_cov215-Cylindrotheca_fusiformis.AAC.4